MAAAYSTINVRPRVGEIARDLAKSRGIPVGALIEQLVEAAAVSSGIVTQTIYEAPRVETVDGQLRIRLDDVFLQIPARHGAAFAQHLRSAADNRPPVLDLDMPEIVFIARRGVGVVVEITRGDGQRVRSITGVYEARQVADAIDQHLSAQ